MDSILILLKDAVEDAIRKNVYIPAKRKDLAVEISVKAVCDSFRKYLIPDNMSNLMSLFSGHCDLKSSCIVNAICIELANELRKKMGGDNNSEKIAKQVVHQVICAFWGEMNVPKGAGFSVDTLVYIFSGNRQTERSMVLNEKALAGDLPLLLEV